MWIRQGERGGLPFCSERQYRTWMLPLLFVGKLLAMSFQVRPPPPSFRAMILASSTACCGCVSLSLSFVLVAGFGLVPLFLVPLGSVLAEEAEALWVSFSETGMAMVGIGLTVMMM